MIPIQRRMIRMDDGHRIHVMLAGASGGIPVVVFHGGPGSGCNASMLRPFDLARFFVVMIDQRGSGRSRPPGRLARNTTAWLLRDVEAVREHLAVPRWYVFGGSWGATLAIAYAGTYPEAVHDLILRGTFLASGREVRGLLSASRFRAPGAWLELYRASGADRPAALLAAIHRRLGKPGPAAWHVAQAYSQLERTLLARTDRSIQALPRRRHARHMELQRAKYLIQTHYLLHQCGLRGGRLVTLAARANAHGVGGAAVHGTRDPVCPQGNLRWLRRKMPKIEPVRVPAGHLASDAPIRSALADALSDISRRHALSESSKVSTTCAASDTGYCG